ncbi:DMT family transporter [Fodinicurvata sp. EGI_FJ10296]|uniref:DMT family transporter n=1 Tax=Fodinicurvata sp. EGI_FJ10296 TaxID=3231908 RepID=UPI0034547876
MSTSSSLWGGTRSNGQAIAVMSAGILCLVVNDAMAKWLTDFYSPLQIVFLRNLLAMPMIAGIVFAVGGRSAFLTPHLGLHALRGLFLVGGAYAFFMALSFLPLAEATSLIFAAPIFITALSVPFLGEQVGWRRWTAVIVGFAGVLIVVRPGAAAFQPASLLVVGTAALYALAMISARWISRDETVWTMMFHVVFFPLLISAALAPLAWQTPQMNHLPLFFGMAVFGTLGMTFITQAFRMAPAAIVAPFDYTALVWASLFGWLIWGEMPGVWTYTGAAVIIASGIYIVVRETRKTPAL